MSDSETNMAETGTIDPNARGLQDWWYPVCFSKDVLPNQPYAIELFAEPMVLWRDAQGKISCAQDKCPHRSAPLSLGRVTPGGNLQCRYHGWSFNTDGKCVNIPSFQQGKEIPTRVCVVTYPACEREGMVFIWPGDTDKCSMDDLKFPPLTPELNKAGEAKDGWSAYDQLVDQDYAWNVLVENLLDPAHLQFTHEGTQGKYIAPVDKNVPEATELKVIDIPEIPEAFKAEIKTDKTTKPQDNVIIFYPPFTVRIEIKFGNGWRFHQVHYCVPVNKNKTRLILRSMRDWLKWMPQMVIWRFNPLVMRQDASILMGQQMRLKQGASRWNYPVAADALGIRFRQWHDKTEASKPAWFKSYSGTSFKKGGGVVKAHVADIEDLPRCIDYSDPLKGSDSPSLRIVRQVISEAPVLWKESGGAE